MVINGRNWNVDIRVRCAIAFKINAKCDNNNYEIEIDEICNY